MSQWISKGKKFEGKTKFWSSNPRKAEKTMKRKSASEKRAIIKKYG
ncbi:hypothetical protein HON71_05595 [Candidatus Woesearchaeota archaeon]|jgi:hypothetical protein|nr:hypothetical protein [Candidatus Woesearchaeota archaeon]MBT5342699.1 hypothetical protein [Candidatus Woesearchaeota archaeon]